MGKLSAWMNGMVWEWLLKGRRGDRTMLKLLQGWGWQWGRQRWAWSVKGKAEHLYIALHGRQTTLKRPGMDHTV